MTKRVYHIWCIFESNVHCYELMKHRFHSLIIHSEPYRAWPIRQVSMLIYWSWCIILLQLLLWNCLDCMIHHKWNVREEQKYICVAWTSNNRVIAACDLYCCLLPRCEALCTCHSGFPIATKWCCDQDVKVMPSSAFTQKNVRSVWFVVKRTGCCCNLSGGVALIVWFTTNRICANNKSIYVWREQAIIEWSRRVISIVACCLGVKLCAYAARDFRLQQYQQISIIMYRKYLIMNATTPFFCTNYLEAQIGTLPITKLLAFRKHFHIIL